MNHGKKFNHLGRKKGHRRALLKNMACALIEHKRINTTVAKAKALRGYIEPLVTKAKTNSTHSRRVVFSYLQNKDAIKELFGPIASEVGNRPGGYVRVIKTGFRKGDAADMAMIEFVDFNKDYSVGTGGEGDSGKSKKRRRRGGKKKAAATAAAATTAAVVAADEAEEAVTETVEEVVETPVVEAASEAPETVVEETTNVVEEAAAPVAAVAEEVTETTETVVENVGHEDPELAKMDAAEAAEDAVESGKATISGGEEE